jgi:hypothetical protein
VFSGLIPKAVETKEVHGLKIARHAPQLAHLFFANDSLLFARANLKEADSILNILSTYQKASGQMVNMEKSEVSYSRNVPIENKEMIFNKMGVKTVDTHSRYLSLPVVFGRSKKVVFSLVQDRVWKKLKGWKEKCLSRAGKEILIKSIVQSIPNYIMSCYKLPDECCKEIEYMAAKFWWGSKDRERKIHWMSWDRMAKAKKIGGMDFRGFRDFNTALLGKQCWRLLTAEESLLGRIFKSRYYPRTSFMEAKLGYQPSYAWRSILSAKDVMDKGAGWRVGNGSSIKIWKDSWLPNQANFKVWSPVKDLPEDSLVECLIDPHTRQWKRDTINSCFSGHESKQIISIPISQSLPPDKYIWHCEKDGEYSVRSAYHLLQELKSKDRPGPSTTINSNLWKQIWKAPLPNSVRNFLWRLGNNILPTGGNLARKGIQLDVNCHLCHSAPETVDHLFMHCPIAKLTWFSSQIGLHTPHVIDINSWILHGLQCVEPMAAKLFGLVLWKLWGARNKCL